MKDNILIKEGVIEIVDIDKKEDDEAFASIALNDQFSYMKFILTDDKPNANKQRIPKEEFNNLIKTGLFTPIKMATGVIEDGHENSVPLGPITHLVQDDDRIKGIAVLWERERPDDVKLVKELYKNNKTLNVSWEIRYGYSSIGEDGVEELKDTSLAAATLVGMPAYEGRTKVLAIASTEHDTESAKWTREYINNLPDSAFLYVEPGGEKDEEGKTVPRTLRHLPYKDDEGNIDLWHLRNAIARLSQKDTGERGGDKWLTEELREKLLEKARNLLERARASVLDNENLNESLKKANEEIDSMKKELEELREFKKQVEKEKEEQKRLLDIKEKFIEAGISRGDEYFIENRDVLLGMSESSLEFLIQELIAFSSKANIETASNKSVPAVLINDSIDSKDPVEIAKALKNRLKK